MIQKRYVLLTLFSLLISAAHFLQAAPPEPIDGIELFASLPLEIQNLIYSFLEPQESKEQLEKRFTQEISKDSPSSQLYKTPYWNLLKQKDLIKSFRGKKVKISIQPNSCIDIDFIDNETVDVHTGIKYKNQHLLSYNDFNPTYLYLLYDPSCKLLAVGLKKEQIIVVEGHIDLGNWWNPGVNSYGRLEETPIKGIIIDIPDDNTIRNKLENYFYNSCIRKSFKKS